MELFLAGNFTKFGLKDIVDWALRSDILAAEPWGGESKFGLNALDSHQ
jgi:hypothetical protein